MKTVSLFAAIIFSLFSISTSTAQTAKTETIKVWGNCGMCKTTIEKAAKKAGAKTANWNEDSKELKVSYTENKTSSAKIQEAIAKSGYDTQDFIGIKSAYDNLPGCCKYDRKEATASAASFACPMKCEGDKMYDKAGKCPSCGMNLKEKKEPVKMEAMNMYSCPMHADVTSAKPGKCSSCGMDLKQKQ
ncbi:MAG: cation transporter [Chitinophagaceae bacterium]|nr:cation transporter [Chitinophagaceae bacterium]